MDDFVGTTRQLAQLLGEDRTVTQAVLRLLRHRGLAQKKELLRRPVRGRPGTVYVIPRTLLVSILPTGVEITAPAAPSQEGAA